MKIAKNSVVQFEYCLKDSNGQLIESSQGAEPTVYLHGHNGMLPALERELEGRSSGEQFSIELEKPYGPSHPDSTQRIPLKHLRAKKKPEPGAVVMVQSKDGPRQVTVVKVGKFSVDVDTNHPFAGMDLTFEVDITGVRPATAEEAAHGHAHGFDGNAGH